MKIHLVFDVIGWAYNSVTTALVKYAPPGMKITQSNRLPPDLPTYDLVVVLPFPRMERFGPQCKMYGVKTAIACYIQLPYCLDEFTKAAEQADHIIFNNWLSYRFWQQNHDMSNCSYLPQGIDAERYYDEKRPDRKDLALLCSSEHFRILKGVEIAKKSKLVVTHVANSFNPKFNHVDMRNLYNQYKVYICLSEYEGTPTPAIEAAHCGCVVISTPVGNMPELISHGFNGFLLSNRDPELFEHLIWNACYNYDSMSANMLASVGDWSWRVRSRGFYNLFRNIITGDTITSSANPDRVLNH